MKKTFLFIFLFSFLLINDTNAQKKFNELINLERYEQANMELKDTKPNERRIVFMGNSITQGWVEKRPDFFIDNNFVGRGIGGQTSPQMLSRFRNDVINLKPIAVIINAGTNDIADNTGKYDIEFTMGNIKSMADMARANNIQVILSSVLPAKGFRWNPEIKDSVEKIEELNKRIKAYAEEMNFLYIDYHSSLKDEIGGLKAEFGDDGVHPNEVCYQVMEKIVLSLLGKNNDILFKGEKKKERFCLSFFF